MTKKYRSKWTRVAVEGATTDGREIQRSWIEDIAATYSRNTYGARVNCEHIKGLAPDSVFGSYGDVLAVKAEEVEIAGEKKLALFAQIEPTEALIALNKKGQKIYTSIEVQPNFAKTGKAYLVGLAVTDSPASLGTEALEFSAQHGTLANRKLHPENLFTAAEEAELQFEEIEEKPSMGAALFAKVQELLKGKQARDDGELAQFSQAVEAIADHVKDLPEKLTQAEQQVTELTSQVQSLQTELNELKDKLGNTHDHHQQQRPPVTGGGSQIKTQF